MSVMLQVTTAPEAIAKAKVSSANLTRVVKSSDHSANSELAFARFAIVTAYAIL